MKKILLAISLFSLLAPASVGVYSTTGGFVGVTNKLYCSTGLTCSKDDEGITVVSSPTLTGTSLTLSTTLAVTGASTLSSATLSGDLTGDGGDQLTGFLQNQVASTTTTITAAQCGTTFISNSADVMTLPEASTVLGCRLTFIVGNVSNFDVNPEASDSILLLTNAAGDAIRADAIGESITLEAISATAWAPVGAEKGTWTDVD